MFRLCRKVDYMWGGGVTFGTTGVGGFHQLK